MDILIAPTQSAQLLLSPLSQISPLFGFQSVEFKEGREDHEFRGDNPHLSVLAHTVERGKLVQILLINARAHADLSWHRADTARVGQGRINQHNMLRRRWDAETDEHLMANLELRWEIRGCGTGPPLPCPHGLCTDGSFWRRQFPQLQLSAKLPRDLPLKVGF